MTRSRPELPERRRSLSVIAVLALSMLLLAGCGQAQTLATRTGALTQAGAATQTVARQTTVVSTATETTVARPDPRTKAALLRIARRFNANYAANRDGAVYDRWDAQSQAIISRSEYVRRHQECQTAPGQATVLGAVHAGSWWLVHYSISGSNMTDYWRYVHGRWLFDLIRSNPQAVRLYQLPATKYLQAVGCAGHS